MAGDIERLRHENPLHVVAADFGLRLEKDGHEFIATCPFHSEDTPSFTIFTGQDGVQRFHCFGCGERGDVLDFVQKIKGVDLKEAIRVLGGELRRENIAPRKIADPVDPYAGIVPLPPAGEIKAGRRVTLWNPKRGKSGTITPSMVFPYRAADGSLIGYVLRHDLQDGGKETPMVMWCEVPGQGAVWCRYPFPKPRPLFGLDRLASGKQVIIAEGEKCATVGAAITGRLFISWPGGTYGIHHTDWSPLAGRSVVIWPDADGPGHDTAAKIGAILLGMGCTVKMIDVSDKPKGWDIADAADEGWSREEIDAFMRARAKPWDGPDGGGGGSVPETPEPSPAPAAEAPDDMPMADYPEPDAGDWVPDPYGGIDQEIQMDKSGDLIEYDKSNRRSIPASGRAKPGIPFRPWGGDLDTLREWVFLSSENVFCHAHTGDRMARGAFDLVMPNITPMIETIDGKGETKNKMFPPSKALIDFCDGLVCSRTMYRPDVNDLTVWVDGVLHLNAYLPASVPVADPNWEQHDAWRAARDHIHNIVPDGADTLIKWMAHNVQFPGKKILWCPILIGQQGDGKTTIGSILQMAMGRRNVVAVGPEELFSDFTSWAEGACVRVLEELHQDGVNRSSVVEKLKAPITNAEVPVVGKGEKGRSVVNVTNYMGLTNNMDGLRIPEGDRRFGVWKTRFTDRGQVLRELTKEYWRRLHSAIGNHPEVLRGWLLSVDLSGFDPFDAPLVTDAKLAMIEASRSPMQADIREAISLGGQGIGRDVLATDCLNDVIQSMGGRKANTTALANILRDLGWAKHGPTVKWNGKPRRVYYLPGDWCAGVEGVALTGLLREKLQETEIDRPEEDRQMDMGGVSDPAMW